MRRARHSLLACLLWLGACGGEQPWLGWGRSGGEHAQGSAKVGGEVVSTVDGVAITVAEVQALVNASGLSPRAALTRLQSQLLLAGEAERRGYGERPEVRDATRQALVQTLLSLQVESVQATEAEIAEAYAKQHPRFHPAERRAAVHVLGAPANATAAADATARRLAEEAVQAFSASSDWEATSQLFAGKTAPEVNVVVQRLPEVERGAFVEAFDRALFGAPAVGAVPQPVKTEYGWHAIYVTKIVPAKDVSLAEATPELRAEIEVAKRQKRFAAMVADLRTEIAVAQEPGSDRILGELEL